jgi:hypothetical protein
MTALALLLLSACGRDVAIAKVQPTLEVQPSVLDFGPVAVGQSATASFTLIHSLGADVEIRDVTVRNIDGDCFVGAAAPTVPSLGSTEWELTCSPDAAGWLSAEVTFTYNRSTNPTVTVLARAEALAASARVVPALVDFGAVPPDTTATANLTLVNDGRVDVTLTGAEFSDGASFALGQSVPFLLAAGESATVPVTYTAPDATAREESVTLLLAETTVSPVTLRANDCENGLPDVYDVDDDGYGVCGGDCDDTRADVRPGGTEAPDGADNDCDGTVDEGTTAYDDDGDGYTEDAGDCRDGDASVNPSVPEDLENGKDDDCDGTTDQGTLDFDADGLTEAAGDCDNADASVYPGAPETPDGVDDDCDGTIDEGTSAYDDDGDGYTEDAGDCDDTNRTTYPGARDGGDWKDNDCDGVIDEGTIYYDDDGDGYAEAGGDCNDANAAVSPAAYEVAGNGVDDDCNGVTE